MSLFRITYLLQRRILTEKRSAVEVSAVIKLQRGSSDPMIRLALCILDQLHRSHYFLPKKHPVVPLLAAFISRHSRWWLRRRCKFASSANSSTILPENDWYRNKHQSYTGQQCPCPIDAKSVEHVDTEEWEDCTRE